MVNSFSLDFLRIDPCEIGSIRGELEYIHTDKKESGTAYPLHDGVSLLLRLPRALGTRESELCAKVMWEAYGVMMRLETDGNLPLKYAAEKAMFARVQDASGNWADFPMEIPPMRPYVEEISFSKANLAKAKDMPLADGYQIELDFRILPNVMTREERARCAYELLAVDSASGERIFSDRTSVLPDSGLKGMWLQMPSKVLERLLEGQRLPAQIKVTSGSFKQPLIFC